LQTSHATTAMTISSSAMVVMDSILLYRYESVHRY